MRVAPMPWRLLQLTLIVGFTAGAVFGLVRGVDYLPTLPFAVVEGALLVGIPAGVLGLLLVGGWQLASTVGGPPRRDRRR